MDPDEGVPFPKMPTVRATGHPNDSGTGHFHPMGLARWTHSHIIAEDDDFETKQVMGAHVERWHFPKEAHDAPE